jgi:uncharacterized coiled-coil protein SlyX
MLEELTKRVKHLEHENRDMKCIIDGRDERIDRRLDEMEERLGKQNEFLQNFKESVDKQFESVDKRFEHVYGQLADINANITEMRNVLAKFVAKLER